MTAAEHGGAHSQPGGAHSQHGGLTSQHDSHMHSQQVPHGELPSHTHSHSHSHTIPATSDARWLWAALILLLAFMLAEVVTAWITGSLALLSDAGHMLSDVGAIAIALWVMRLMQRPATARYTFGLKRAEILSAAVNGSTMLVVAGIILVEAIHRLIEPPAVEGGPVLVVAIVGIAVNIVVAWLVARANRASLNIEGAYKHILTDLFGFIGTALAGLVILLTGFTRADAIASLIVVALMLGASYGLLRDAGRILLERAPEGVDVDEVRSHILGLEHVVSVHDLHVWSLSSDLPAISAHVVVSEECFHDGHAAALLDEVQACLIGHFDLEHSTFQFEPAAHAGHEAEMHA